MTIDDVADFALVDTLHDLAVQVAPLIVRADAAGRADIALACLEVLSSVDHENSRRRRDLPPNAEFVVRTLARVDTITESLDAGSLLDPSAVIDDDEAEVFTSVAAFAQKYGLREPQVSGIVAHAAGSLYQAIAHLGAGRQAECDEARALAESFITLCDELANKSGDKAIARYVPQAHSFAAGVVAVR